jgi:serine/threonine-protein kinase
VDPTALTSESRLNDCVPKITDFGLAKYLEDEPGAPPRTPTRDGQILGTPSYMAPEQARGQARAAGPAADVYALGAILYELLTGRPPFLAATPLETMRQVVDEEPVPPRRLQSGVARDLETVCLKCLEKKPEKRYQSALALAEDLRRFREGRPISARPVGRVGRGWRWCRRNPLSAALLALLALTCAGGFSAVTALWLRAARQAHRAEVSVAHDRKVMRDYFTRVSDDLRLQQPGARPLRKEMAEAALAYLQDYQAVLREQGDDPGTRAELSRTYWCMGELMRLLGPADDALPNLKQAAALQEQLLAADPGDARLREDLAHSYSSLGNLHAGRGRHEEALRVLRHALDVLGPLTGAGQTPASAREVLAGVYVQLGLVHGQNGLTSQALECLRHACGLHEQLVRELGPTPRLEGKLAVSYFQLAGRHLSAGEASQAAGLYGKARDILERLVRDHPGGGPFHRDLAATVHNLATLCNQANRPREALAVLERARQLQARVWEGNPEVLAYERAQAFRYEDMGRAQLLLSRWADARASFQAACDLLEKLVRAGAEGVPAHDLLKCYSYLGTVQASQNEGEQALGSYRKALALLKTFARESPEAVDNPVALGEGCYVLGGGLMSLGRAADALPAFREAVGYQKVALDRARQKDVPRKALSQSYYDLGHVQRELGLPAEAAAICRERLRLWPDNADQVYDGACELAQCILAVGKGKKELNAQEQAERQAYADEAVQVLRRAVALGLKDAQGLQKDPDLAPLRGRADFRRLVEEMGGK